MTKNKDGFLGNIGEIAMNTILIVIYLAAIVLAIVAPIAITVVVGVWILRAMGVIG